jgi:hypothetical protein
LEPRVVIKLVNELSPYYKTIDILAVLEVPKAAYYRWKKKYSTTMPTAIEEIIIQACEDHFFRYGNRKIKALLKRKYNININRKTVQKIIQK